MEEPETQFIFYILVQKKLSIDAATAFFPKCTSNQSAIFGFTDHKINYSLLNHILLIFKYYGYKTGENGSLGLKV